LITSAGQSDRRDFDGDPDGSYDQYEHGLDQD